MITPSATGRDQARPSRVWGSMLSTEQGRSPILCRRCRSAVEDEAGAEDEASARSLHSAIINILEDFAADREHLSSVQAAMLNILQDINADKATADQTSRAIINILDDFAADKQWGESTRAAMVNILEDVDALKRKLEERAAQLTATNKELEAFTYTVSHDLRAPIRAMLGFSRILVEEKEHVLPPEVERYLQKVRSNAEQMGQLVDDLLAFSRLGRQGLRIQTVEPARLAEEVLSELRPTLEGRDIRVSVEQLPRGPADAALLKQVYVNLLENAFKFTRYRAPAEVWIGCQEAEEGPPVYFVRDNGVGFDMRYADKLFGVFQRLHSTEEFEGTGVGLATVQRIIHKHGGRVWAEGKPDQGAAFYFTLGGTDDGSARGDPAR